MNLRKIIRESIDDSFEWTDIVNSDVTSVFNISDDLLDKANEIWNGIDKTKQKTIVDIVILKQQVQGTKRPSFRMLQGLAKSDQSKLNMVKDKWKDVALNESVKLPVEVGDTVYMGRFKNKKTVVKTIEWNAKGDLMINGKSALKMRIPKKKKKLKESEFDWTKEIKPLEQQTAENWVGRTFGYGGELKDSFNEDNLDREETFEITGIDEHGYLILTKHHPIYDDKTDIGTTPSSLKKHMKSGDWVWVQ